MADQIVLCVIHVWYSVWYMDLKTLFTVLFIGLPLEAIYTTYNEMVCD